MKIGLRETSDGIVLPVKVSAGSRIAGIRGIHEGALKISVTVAPEKGKANQAVIKLLAKALGVPRSSLQIVSGTTNTQKQILVAGQTINALRDRIDELLL